MEKGIGSGTSEPVARKDLREAAPPRKQSSYNQTHRQHIIRSLTIDNRCMTIYAQTARQASIVCALRVTPAMKAGVTSRLWNVEYLLAEA